MSEHPVLTLIRSKLADPSRPFTLLAELQAKPGQGDAVAAAIAASGAIALTQREPGCLAYDLCRDREAPDRFVAYEHWRDLPALQRHLSTPHFTHLGTALQPLLAAAPTLRVLSPVSA